MIVLTRQPTRRGTLIHRAGAGAYLTGLRAGGWRGRNIRVRHAIAATGAAKFCWLAR